MKTMRESLETPVLGDYDVIVCGGGVAGASAAAAAARSGSKVLLIEKGVILGGLATQGLIAWFEPLCDGHGRRVLGGMVEELFRLCIQFGPDTLPKEWENLPESADSKPRCATHYSPAILAMALDEWLVNAGVEILLDTVVTAPVMQGAKCDGIIVENKTGRGVYTARAVVDTTGDLDIMHRAGIQTVHGQNFLSYVAYVADEKQYRKALETGNAIYGRRWQKTGADLWGKGHPEDEPLLSGVTAEEVTKFVLSSRRMMFDKLREGNRMARDVTALPSMAQLRTTRRLAGAYELTEDDQGRRFDDSVALVTDFVHKGRVYEVPFRTLYSPQCENIITAGRTISSSGWAWDVTRVIPSAIATGQAAGIAAMLCASLGTGMQHLDIPRLQGMLARQGARFSLN